MIGRSALDVAGQVTAFELLVESVAVVACRVVVGALVAAQVVVLAAGPVLVDVVAIDLVGALGCEGAQRRIVEVARVLAVVPDTALHHLVAFALLRLRREQLRVGTYELAQLTVHALVVAAAARRLYHKHSLAFKPMKHVN